MRQCTESHGCHVSSSRGVDAALLGCEMIWARESAGSMESRARHLLDLTAAWCYHPRPEASDVCVEPNETEQASAIPRADPRAPFGVRRQTKCDAALALGQRASPKREPPAVVALAWVRQALRTFVTPSSRPHGKRRRRPTRRALPAHSKGPRCDVRAPGRSLRPSPASLREW